MHDDGGHDFLGAQLVYEADHRGVSHVNELGSEEVVAAVVVNEGFHVDTDEIRAKIKESLAAYKVPRKVFVLPELPKNNMGKVLRREVRTAVEKLREGSAELAEKAEELAGKAVEAASEFSEGLSERAGELAGKAVEVAAEVSEKVKDAIRPDDQPDGDGPGSTSEGPHTPGAH